MKNKGFTLVELLAVIAILAILVIIALPNVLKMFNDSKKNSFLTEAKTLYSEVSKKYISETMKGNKLTYISSEDDTKLEMTGRNLQYCVLLNTDGSVKSMKVSNGEWIAELPSGKKITDLKNADLKDGNLNDYDCYNPFRDDSWETIASNVKAGSTSNYHVGDEKEVDLGTTYGKHMVRIANMSTPNECNDSNFSQTACGFVIEFADIIAYHIMNPSGPYNGTLYSYGWSKDGWPGSRLYDYINVTEKTGSGTIYNALPEELRNAIIDTTVVSSLGSEDKNRAEGNFVSTDKLYLLSPEEVYGTSFTSSYDTSRGTSRQLDYYATYVNTDGTHGVTTSKYAGAIKKNRRNSASYWWLRSAGSNGTNYFYGVKDDGNNRNSVAYTTDGVSPAFRIG